MSAPERVRAYLTARTRSGVTARTVAFIADPDSPPGRRLQYVELQEADLEACLQTIDILAKMLAQQAESTPDFVLRAAEYAINIKDIPDANH